MRFNEMARVAEVSKRLLASLAVLVLCAATHAADIAEHHNWSLIAS